MAVVPRSLEEKEELWLGHLGVWGKGSAVSPKSVGEVRVWTASPKILEGKETSLWL